MKVLQERPPFAFLTGRGERGHLLLGLGAHLPQRCPWTVGTAVRRPHCQDSAPSPACPAAPSSSGDSSWTPKPWPQLDLQAQRAGKDKPLHTPHCKRQLTTAAHSLYTSYRSCKLGCPSNHQER